MATARRIRGSGPVSDTSLVRVLGQFERNLSRSLEASLAKDGLTLELWLVLDLLSDGKGHPMSEIAAKVVVPGPTLTKLVDKLVDAALVYRLVDDLDRRRVLAFASDKGRALRKRVAPKVAVSEAAALSVLGDDGPVLLSLLARIADSYA